MKRLRALWFGLWFGRLPCRTCGRPCVGYSFYCRRHTDEILEGKGGSDG